MVSRKGRAVGRQELRTHTLPAAHWSVRYRGREVEHPAARVLVIVFAMGGACVGVLGAALFLFVGLPLCLLLHGPLRLLGRRGTVRSDGTTFVIRLDREAFRR